MTKWAPGHYPQMARKPNAAMLEWNGKGSEPKKPSPTGSLPLPTDPPASHPEPRTLREKLAARRKAERGIDNAP